MSLTASAHSVSGALRQELLVDGRHHLVTDEPKRLGGGGTGPSPHELLPAALASCISTTLVRYGLTKDWDLGTVDVDVDYDHKATPRRRFHVDIHIGAVLDNEQRTRLEKVAAACPLRRALEAGFEFEEHLTASGSC